MESLSRLTSPMEAKPYRNASLVENNPESALDRDGCIAFAPNDVENPQNWSSARRWYISLGAILAVVNATFASSGPSGCLDSIAQDLHVSTFAAGLVTTVFLLAYCAGPLFWAPVSEMYGRKWIFTVSFTGYIIFNFLCAFAPNFAGLLVGRFFTGLFASSTLSNAPGLLSDVWTPVERGNAFAIFSVATFAGPALGPVVAGFVELKKDWRWIFYVVLMMAGLTVPFLLGIPETSAPHILMKKAKRLRDIKAPGRENAQSPLDKEDRKLSSLFRVAFARPPAIFFDPISLVIALYTALIYTLLYMLFAIYPIVFREKRGWNAGVSELPLIGTIIGACIAGCFVFYNSRLDRAKLIAGTPRVPEDRLTMAKYGGILFPITMFWFSWTAQYNSIHWIVPTLAGTFLSTSFILLFVPLLNYLADCYLKYSASAFAGNSVFRSFCGASTPLFTGFMFDSLTVAGGGSLIAGVGCLLALAPFVLIRYGERIRKRSKWCTDFEKEAAEKQAAEKEAAEKKLESRSPSTGASSASDG